VALDRGACDNECRSNGARSRRVRQRMSFQWRAFAARATNIVTASASSIVELERGRDECSVASSRLQRYVMVERSYTAFSRDSKWQKATGVID